MLVFHTSGPVGAAALASEMLKAMVGAGVDWAGRTMVCDPINSAARPRTRCG